MWGSNMSVFKAFHVATLMSAGNLILSNISVCGSIVFGCVDNDNVHSVAIKQE